MNPVNRLASRTRTAPSIPFGILLIASSVLPTLVILTVAVTPATAQYGNELELRGTRSPIGAPKSKALGIAKDGWEPLTIVGVSQTTTGQDKASCWIRVSQQWTVHELPGLDPNMNSWAYAVVHVPWTDGEYTIVAGAAEDSQGTQKPMTWDNVTNQPWSGHALPTLNGGDGEAYAMFLPDGTPVRALYCGWSGEIPPMAAAAARGAPTTNVAVPVIWETTATGERVMRPTFGAGLPGQANDIGSAGIGGFIAVGGGQTGTGQWLPQVWMSADDGASWQNTELPLPLGMDSGEATCNGGHENGHNLGVGGYAESSGGARVPVFWDIDLNDAAPTWVAHELPLPVGKEGGQNNVVRKRPGRLKFAGAVQQAGVAELAVWTDDGTGWIVETPADYLVNPQEGTPISAAGIDAFGRIAVTAVPPPPVASAAGAAALTDTTAAVLIPSPATDVGPGNAPRKFIALTASPNPFNPRVRIGYTLPRDGRVVVTIHDAAGHVVTSLDEGFASEGVERAMYWDGSTQDGGRATSGIYFVRVATDYEIATAKIVLVK